MVISHFYSQLNLGTLNNLSEIYFDSKLIKVIDFDQCPMKLKGQVVSTTVKSSIIQEYYSRDLYIVNNTILSSGTEICFHGTKIQCITTPCYNIVDCYEVIKPVSEPECIMDKEGIIVAGKGECSNRLFVQELTPYYAVPRLYAFVDNWMISNKKAYTSGLNIGDKVTFSSVEIAKDTDIDDIQISKMTA